MENFTPYSALAGGVLIGFSVVLMLLFSGRVTGISGIFSNLLKPIQGQWLWRFVFIFGMTAGVTAYILIIPGSFIPRTGYSPILLGIAGFLVGFGTRLGNGCTSGHAICGISRFSSRSIVATLVFMFSGGMTVYIMRHIMDVS